MKIMKKKVGIVKEMKRMKMKSVEMKRMIIWRRYSEKLPRWTRMKNSIWAMNLKILMKR